MYPDNKKTKNNLVSICRALSKLGYCSRSEAEKYLVSGRIKVNNKTIFDPSFRVDTVKDKISVDDINLKEKEKVYIALNKPKGLITTAKDEKDRSTVFSCFVGSKLPYIFPVGRLDMASEGLLLFTNDTVWSDAITSRKIEKIYHVHIDTLADDELLISLKKGMISDGEFLAVKNAKLLRSGKKNAWLEITLNEGKNRHIRRLLKENGIAVLRLIRVSIGKLKLGNLKKGEWKHILADEVL